MTYFRLPLTAVTLAVAAVTTAHTVNGVVRDARTGEPIIGAIVMLHEQSKVSTVTGLDGSFRLSELPDNKPFTLSVRSLGYRELHLPVPVHQHEPLQVEMHEDSRELHEVVVQGNTGKRTDASAVQTVKNAAQVLNIMSRQAMQLSPDINVASVLQRVSGVTMERDAGGEATYAVLRGMDKRYNYTLVNGVKIPSPDDKNRYLPLNLFPSELMDRVVVSKSLTPDMEGDASGGVVDMEMRDAPTKRLLQAHAAVGVTDYFWGQRDYLSTARSKATTTAPYERWGADYRASTADFSTAPSQVSRRSNPLPHFTVGVAAGQRFWHQRLGVMVAATAQSLYRGTERSMNTVSMPYGERAEIINKMQSRQYSTHQFLMGLHAKLDFTFGAQKLEWHTMWVNKQEDGVRYTQSVVTDYGYDPSHGLFTRDDELRSSTQTQRIWASHLKGLHALGDLRVEWSAQLSQARANDPDRTYIGLKNSVVGGSVSRTVPNSMERRFQHNEDGDAAVYLHLSYPTAWAQWKALWKAGTMYRAKKRENRFYAYQFQPEDISATLSGSGWEQFAATDWMLRTPFAQASQLNYNSDENIGAVYAMTTLSHSRWEVVAGVRAEHTYQTYRLLQQFDGMGSLGAQGYWDWLPSLAVRLKATKDMNLRLSYYRSINRPSFYEIVPYTIDGEEYNEKGNPTLRRAKIDNVDLRWEWFPSKTEQVLLGVFYKRLQDPIEQTFYNDVRQTNNAYYMPQNLGDAHNWGVEIDVVKYIRHWGLKANYTYTHSRITTPKRQFKEGSAEVETALQHRPLVNQAPHTANLSLLYKDTKHGWSGQLAASYTGEKLALVSPFKDADQWERPICSLDVSVEKTMGRVWTIFFKGNNLTNARRERFLKTVNPYNLQFEGQRSDRTTVATYTYGRTMLLGVRCTF